MTLVIRAIAVSGLALAVAACDETETDAAAPAGSVGEVGLFPPPTERYDCDGVMLAVRLLGEAAAVSVDGAEEVELPQIVSEGTVTQYSNGMIVLEIRQGAMHFARGRAAPQPCSAVG